MASSAFLLFRQDSLTRRISYDSASTTFTDIKQKLLGGSGNLHLVYLKHESPCRRWFPRCRRNNTIVLETDGDWETAVQHAQKHNYELEILAVPTGGSGTTVSKKTLFFFVLFILFFNALIRGFSSQFFAAVLSVLVTTGFAFGCGGHRSCRRNNNNKNNNCRAEESKQQSKPQQQQQQQPEQGPQFREQLQTLFDLGFNDVLQNVEQLRLAKGDINIAVQGLLNQNKQQQQ